MWGIIPAAGNGTRIQPLAFSKELLPVGSWLDPSGSERPRAVGEHILERMTAAGVDKICLVVSPEKTDILRYFGGKFANAALAYVVQNSAEGLCDAIFSAAPVIAADEPVVVGLPDTIWFPLEGLRALPDDRFSFLLFPVEHPEFFDAVEHDKGGRIRRILVKSKQATDQWIWGAFKMPGHVFHALHRFWQDRERPDEFIGTLVNAWIKAGNAAWAVHAGERYVDVGTFDGYRQASLLLDEQKRAHAAALGRSDHNPR